MSDAFGGRILRAVSVLVRSAAMVLLFLPIGIGRADTRSFSGTLVNPEDTVLIDLTLNTPGVVTLQTYGFGGGVNAAGTTVLSGGFDPFVGIFSGTGANAVFIDGTSDILSNYSFGCPPAGTVTVGSVPGQCGDVNLQLTSLPAGTYTVLLSDGEYISNAVFESSPGYLGDGFTDFTAGVFQTCYDANNCNTDTANWALDITAPADTFAPEPGSWTLAGLGVAVGAWVGRRKIFKKKGRSFYL